MASAVDWSSISVTGLGHILNQDRVGTDGSMFCLADGMGGPAGGHIAATAAIRAVLGAKPDDRAALERAMVAAHHAVRAAGQRRLGESEMGTTLTALLVRDGGVLVCAVGDTRCYLSDSSGVRQLTTDDTIAQSMEIPADDERYPKATSMLTQNLGGPMELDLQVIEVPITESTTVILTTDGVHEHVTDDDLEHDPAVTLDQHALDLVATAQERGSQDDASAFVIAIDP